MFTIVNTSVASNTRGPKFCQKVAKAVLNRVPTKVPSHARITLRVPTSIWNSLLFTLVTLLSVNVHHLRVKVVLQHGSSS